MGDIRPIRKSEIKKIVSGQVISDLSSAVKELIDNALDAGARTINIRLFNQGLDIIEVSDDGMGIPPHSRPFVAMKHTTSKLQSFQELYVDTYDPHTGQLQLKSFGFRGEALFALANLSKKLLISTRCCSLQNNNGSVVVDSTTSSNCDSDEELGQRMEFTRDGTLNPNVPIVDIPRKVGTTVAVVQLFDALPVRRADLVKKIKVYRGKLLKMIQSYSILCVGVKFNFYDITGPVGSPSCKTDLNLSTSERSSSIRETISAVLGSKFLSGLCPMSVDLSSIVNPRLIQSQPQNNLTYEKDTTTDDHLCLNKPSWRLEGFIAKAPCTTNDYKESRDIQFFSINGRPVELPKLSKLINSVWRNTVESGNLSNSLSQSMSSSVTKKHPACFLGLFLPHSMYDVNVAPDKRQVFLVEEDLLFDLIRNALVKLWSASQSEVIFHYNQVSNESNSNNGNLIQKNKKRSFEESPFNQEQDGINDDQDRTLKQSQQQENAGNNLLHQFSYSYDSASQRNLDSAQEDRQESVRPHKRMRRRNAFVNSFDNVGTMSSDYDGESNSTHFNAQYQNDNSKIDESMNSLISDNTLGRNQRGSTMNWCDGIQNVLTTRQENLSNEIEKEPHEQQYQEQNLNDLSSSSSYSTTNNVTPTKIPIYAKQQSDISKYTYVVKKDRKDVTSSITTPSPKKVNLSNNKVGIVSVEDRRPSPTVNDSEQRDYDDEGSTCSSSSDSSHDRTISTTSDCIVDKTLQQDPQIKEKRNTNDQYCQLNHNVLTKTNLVSPPPLTDGDIEERKGRNDDIANSSQPAENEKNEIIWNTFQGTDHVVQLAQQARIHNIQLKHQLMSTRKDMNTSKSQNSNLNSLDDEDWTGESDKIDKKSDNNKQTVSLSKTDFTKMRILGQFNLGFILALCENNNLWILDQHACDEKYNFEKLCSESIIHEQRLLKPLPLELSPSEEHIILQHQSIFEKNGFRFIYDESKPPRHRFALTAVPHHSASSGDGRKAVQFGKDDVLALCAILGADDGDVSNGPTSGTGADGSGSMVNNAVRRYAGLDVGGEAIVRLPKTVAMFASRACRGSVMIGEALSQSQMEQIIQRLANVQQPWNCPHGRPTIRHIKGLIDDLLQDERSESKRFANSALSVLSQYGDE